MGFITEQRGDMIKQIVKNQSARNQFRGQRNNGSLDWGRDERDERYICGFKNHTDLERWNLDDEEQEVSILSFLYFIYLSVQPSILLAFLDQ